MVIRMDDCTGKHSVKGLRTCAQRMMANIPTGRVEKLLLSVSSFFFLPPKSKED
jgi:hypothetical protein